MSGALVLYSEITGRYLVKVKDGRSVTTAKPEDARTYDSWRYAETALSLLPDKYSAGWQIMGRDAAMMKGGSK